MERERREVNYYIRIKDSSKLSVKKKKERKILFQNRIIHIKNIKEKRKGEIKNE